MLPRTFSAFVLLTRRGCCPQHLLLLLIPWLMLGQGWELWPVIRRTKGGCMRGGGWTILRRGPQLGQGAQKPPRRNAGREGQVAHKGGERAVHDNAVGSLQEAKHIPGWQCQGLGGGGRSALSLVTHFDRLSTYSFLFRACPNTHFPHHSDTTGTVRLGCIKKSAKYLWVFDGETVRVGSFRSRGPHAKA